MKQFSFLSRGFTLIELIVGMTIFAIGLSGVYALLQTTMSQVASSRDESIVAGLLSEQLELLNVQRDMALANFLPWDTVIHNATQTGWTRGIYTIESNFSSSGIVFDSTKNDGTIRDVPILVKKIDQVPLTLSGMWIETQLRLDQQGRYIHSSDATLTGTIYASYLSIEPLGFTGSSGFTEIKKDGKNQGIVVTSYVIVERNGGYEQYDANMILTDWQK